MLERLKQDIAYCLAYLRGAVKKSVMVNENSGLQPENTNKKEQCLINIALTSRAFNT